VGEGITESVLLKWHVDPGQTVREDDTLCVIETDKAVVEIPAPCTGTVTSLDVAEGARIPVGTVIAQVEPDAGASATAGAPRISPDGGTSVASPAPASAPPAPGSASQAASAPVPYKAGPGRTRAAPSTRRLASELRVDLSGIHGQGPHGRILRSDVQAAVAAEAGRADDAGLTASRRSRDGASSRREPMTNLRRTIAENMRRSVAIIPHATTSFRCDAGALLELREHCQQRLAQRISLTAMFMKAMIPALRAYPYFNASIDDDAHEIVLHDDHNFGFATHTPEGLIVPVVKDVARKSLLEVTAAIERLAALARERRVPVADLRGGTITLSNIGSHGGREIGGRPIISHPQVALIATGRIRPEPAVRDNLVVPRPTLIITVSFDHRLIDGAYAAGFMDRVIDIIEAPGMLLAYT
jgi:pyruvate dehydrogenase E2 component (dihydrolipoamide acetyltransferase)